MFAIELAAEVRRKLVFDEAAEGFAELPDRVGFFSEIHGDESLGRRVRTAGP